MNRLIVVSNRVQPTSLHDGGGSQGGLSVALSAALREDGGIWFGWSGEVTENYTGGMHFENPYSCEEVSEAIIQALAMPLQERQRRWRQLNDTVCSQDAAWWRKMFINFLSAEPVALPIRS